MVQLKTSKCEISHRKLWECQFFTVHYKMAGCFSLPKTAFYCKIMSCLITVFHRILRKLTVNSFFYHSILSFTVKSWSIYTCTYSVCVLFHPDSNSQPVDYPDWCEVIRKPDSCTTVAVMRANHKLPCLYGKWGRMRPDTWKPDNELMF